jgi:hypothetical protein
MQRCYFMSRLPSWRVPALSLVTTLLFAGVCRADDGAYSFREARQFLGQFCVECHGPEKPRAKLNLQRFETQEKVLADRKVWDEILSRVRGREMPPPDAEKTAPTEEARRAFVRWAEQTLRGAACDDTLRPGPAPVRRLNKSQYRATIRDLLSIHFDASHALPDDGAGGEGFDNAAETLFLSPVHAEKYLEAAKKALRYAASDSAARARVFVALPDDKTTAEEAARRVLERFAARAYRRPVRAGEVDRLLVLFRKEQARGQPFDDAVLYALQAVLISPHFLFRVEEPEMSGEPKRLTDYELATRLSYFLWDSMPDDRLFELAAAGKLQEEGTLKAEMARLLKDRKARGLAESFAGQWLETRRLGTEVKPDRKLFPRYTDELENAMREEPILFLQEILADNRSLVELLDADFTYTDQAWSGITGYPHRPDSGSPGGCRCPRTVTAAAC